MLSEFYSEMNKPPVSGMNATAPVVVAKKLPTTEPVKKQENEKDEQAKK
jgi:hypothetical protein